MGTDNRAFEERKLLIRFHNTTTTLWLSIKNNQLQEEGMLKTVKHGDRHSKDIISAYIYRTYCLEN